MQDWSAEVQSKLFIHITVYLKLYMYEFENYLVKLDFADLGLIYKFRCGNHRLHVANG